jgi:hypothetical protein
MMLWVLCSLTLGSLVLGIRISLPNRSLSTGKNAVMYGCAEVAISLRIRSEVDDFGWVDTKLMPLNVFGNRQYIGWRPH